MAYKTKTIGLCIPLLAVVCPLSTSSGTLVARVTGDTGSVSSVQCEEGLRLVIVTPWLRLMRKTAKIVSSCVRWEYDNLRHRVTRARAVPRNIRLSLN